MRTLLPAKSMPFLLLACGGALSLATTGCPLTVDGGSGGEGGGGGTSNTGGTGDTGGWGPESCPEPSPPVDPPWDCSYEGLYCEYGDMCCDPDCYSIQAIEECDCTDGKWVCHINECGAGCDPGAAEVLAEPDPNDPNAPLPDPADEDCDGLIDKDDPDLQPCDGSLALDSADPMDAVKALGICDLDANGSPRFVTKATWVLADGSPPEAGVDMVKYHLGHGLLDHFGQNDKPREGARMLALSSGTARNVDEAGFVSRNFDKGYSSSLPLLFSGVSAACPGTAVSTDSVQDAAGLELEMKAPTNALGLELRFRYLTHDFPEYVCTPYNDFFWANFDQGGTHANLAFDAQGDAISGAASFITQCDCPPAGPGTCDVQGQGLSLFDCQGTDLLAGTDFDGSTNPMPTYQGWSNAGTGWLRTTAPVTPGMPLTLRFTVFDSGVTAQGVTDHNLDSTVLVDAFRWRSVPVPYETAPE